MVSGHYPVRVKEETCEHPTAVLWWSWWVPTVSHLVRLPCHAFRGSIQESGNEEASHWTNTQLSHLQEKEGSRSSPPALPWREAVSAYGHRTGTRKGLPSERLLGLDKVQVQFRRLVPDAQAVLGPGWFLAGTCHSDMTPACWRDL